MTWLFTLCADDYGMSEGVSTGILEAARAARINAASAMTSLPDWPRAAAVWNETRPPATLGLHLNLTVGAPLGPMPALAPGDVFPAIGVLARARDLPGNEIGAEIGRQIDAFVAHAGRAPDHVDGHQHVHVLPVVREALFGALRARGYRAMPLRDSGDRPTRILRRRSCVPKALAVATLARGFAAAAREAGFPCNDGFTGFSTFDPQADPVAQFARYLVAPGRRHLVMCHPGYVDDALRALDPVTAARETELRFLLSDAWPALLARAGVALHAP